MKIAGTRALVTGAGSGLGRALSLRLAEAGAEVVVSDKDEAAAGATAQQVLDAGGKAHAMALDITESTGIEAAVEALQQRGGLDILVNNAGIAASGTVEDSSETQWRQILEINLLGTVNVTRAFLPLLQAARKACIVNVASAAALTQLPGLISYNVSKAAVIAFSESLRHEMLDSSVRVVLVCPSFFKTNLLDSALDMTEEQARFVGDLMQRSRVQADDVARTVARAIRMPRFMVITHGRIRFAYWIKRVFPRLYVPLVVRPVQRYARNNPMLQNSDS